MTITANIHAGLLAWANATYAVGNRRSAGGNAYGCITAGSSTAAPTGTGASINNGGAAVWKWLSAIDYTSLQAWATALPGTLTQPMIAALWNNGTITTTAGTAFLSLTGHTTSSTNTVTIQAAPGEGFRDQPPGTALTFNAANGVSFTLPSSASAVNYFDIVDANVTLKGLQFKDPLATSTCTILQADAGSSPCTILDCIFDGYAQSGAPILTSNTAKLVVLNTLILNRTTGTGGGNSISLYQGNNSAVVDCSIVGLGGTTACIGLNSNIGADSTGVIIRNSIVTGHTPAIDGYTAATMTADHCLFDTTGISGLASDGGGNLFSKTAANQFISTTADFRLKSGADAINAGTPAATYVTDDILGNTRPQGVAWDIGAMEYGAPATGALTGTQTQTLTGTAAAIVGGSLAVTQSQSLVATAGNTVAGRLAGTQSNQTFAGVGSPVASASLGTLQAAQTFVGTFYTQIVGQLAITQTATLSAVGLVLVQGNLSASQPAQTLAAAGLVNTGLALSVVQPAQTLVAAARAITGGSLTVTQTQSLVASGTSQIFGSLSVTQTQTLTGLGGPLGVANLNAVQPAQTLTAAAGPIIGGSLSVFTVQTLAATGVLPITGFLFVGQGPQTVAAIGGPGVAGSLSASQPAQSLAAAGGTLITGALAAVELPDGISAAGGPLAVLALTQFQAQSLSAVGGPVAVAGLIAAQPAQTLSAIAGNFAIAGASVTEVPDTLVASGGTVAAGSLSVVEVPDILAAAGGVLASGSLSIVEVPDTIAASAFVYSYALALTQAPQTLAGLAFDAILGQMATTETPDTIAAGASISITGGLNLTAGNAALAATVSVTVSGSLTTLQANHGLVASLGAVALLALNGTQADQTVAGQILTGVVGNASLSQDPQTLVATNNAVAGLIALQADQVLAGSVRHLFGTGQILTFLRTPKL